MFDGDGEDAGAAGLRQPRGFTLWGSAQYDAETKGS